MNAKKIGLLALALAIALSIHAAPVARAQMVGIEPIVATLGALPPTNVFERFYPNEFDLLRQKRFTFIGTVTNANLQQPAFVDLWFDWIDPRDPQGTPPRITGVFPIDLAPGQSKSYGGPTGLPPITTTIPICPPQVSIHIQNNGPGQPVIVDGTFIHECLIPEPATATLGGLAMLALATAARRRG